MKKEVINYLFFGVLTTLINIISYWVLTEITEIHYTSATVLSWIIAVLFAYVTNKVYVFKTAFKDFTQFIKEVGYFFIFRLLSLALDLGLMILLVSLLQVNDLVAKVTVNVLIVIVNYLLSKFIVFTKRTPTLERSND